jgi:hypothetical protein
MKIILNPWILKKINISEASLQISIFSKKKKQEINCLLRRVKFTLDASEILKRSFIYT